MTTAEKSQLFQKGLKAGRERRYADAVKVFTRLVEGEDPRTLLLLGRSYHGLGDYLQAVHLFHTGLKLYGASPEYHFFLGRSYLAAGSAEQAITWLEKAYREKFGGSQTLGLLGSAYLKAKNPAKAVEILEKAVGVAPGNRGIYIAYLNALYVRALQLFHAGNADLSRQILLFLLTSGAESEGLHLYLASCFRELGQYSDAIPHLTAARQTAPDDPVLVSQMVEALMATGQREQARQLMAQYQEVLPKGTAPSPELVEELLPWQYLNQGKLRRAVYFALKVLKRKPDFAEMSLVIGEAYRRLGQDEKAEAHLERARKNPSVSLQAEYSLLSLHWQNGRYQKALTEAQRLKKLTPSDDSLNYYITLLKCELDTPPRENIEALRSLIARLEPDPFLFAALAKEYQKCGLEDLAHPWLKRALKLDPQNKSAVETLALILPTLEVPDWKQAFEQYLELRPTDQTILRVFTQRLLEAKDWPEAQQRLLQWISQGHRTHGNLRALAYVYRMRNLFSEAFLIYRDLLHQEPKNPEYLSGVILCLYKLGKKELALEFARKAAATAPQNARFAYQIGLIAQACHDREQAERSFRKAIEIETNHWPSYLKLSELFAEAGDSASAERYKKHAEALKLKT